MTLEVITTSLPAIDVFRRCERVAEQKEEHIQSMGLERGELRYEDQKGETEGTEKEMKALWKLEEREEVDQRAT